MAKTQQIIRRKTTVAQGRLTEKKQIQIGLKRMGNRAYLDTLSQGLPVTVLCGNRVCRVDEKGVSVVSKVPQAKYRVTQRSFKLKK